MTKIKKITIPILILSAAAVLLSSCGEGTTDRLTAAEVEAIESYVMSSYFMLRGDAELAESRAAWDYTKEVQLPAEGQTTTALSKNYPEKGQETNVSITVHNAANSVYKVVNVTTYPKQDSIVSTTESYYIKDNGDGYLNKTDAVTADYICDENGDTSAANSNSRIEFETLYADGNIRYEIIEANTNDGSNIKYAAFDIDGALTFPEPNQPDGETWAPEEDTDAIFSSMVSYQQVEGSALDVWNDYKMIIGTRYYTEDGTNLNKPHKTSVSYEKVIERKADDLDAGEKIVLFLNRLFSDEPAGMAFPGETLAETVIRYEIKENSGKKTINTQTEIYDGNIGASVVTFKATYETADDGTVLQSGLPVATYY